MTIRDLLAAESINLNGTPAGKTEALNQCSDSKSTPSFTTIAARPALVTASDLQ